MRTSPYYSRKHGARVVEVLRGCVSTVESGGVEWFPPDEVPMRGLLKFLPRMTISGKPARELGAELSAIAGGNASISHTDLVQEVVRRPDDVLSESLHW
jgi:hypothetical protein